jgi:UDP-2,3-diacylglucosamine pyrophosphatase LpxH
LVAADAHSVQAAREACRIGYRIAELTAEALPRAAHHRKSDRGTCGSWDHRRFHDAHSLNCGDWVESCTAVIETLDGHLGVVRWEEVVCSGAQSSLPFALPAA